MDKTLVEQAAGESFEILIPSFLPLCFIPAINVITLLITLVILPAGIRQEQYAEDLSIREGFKKKAQKDLYNRNQK